MDAGKRRGIAVGVAGMMGAGKSTVARTFEEMGAVRIDADELGKSLLKDGQLKRDVVEAFGESILGPDGEIDTAKLGEAAFADDACALKLNEITRGPLVSKVMRTIESLRGSAEVVVVDAALLPEWGGHAWLDFLVVVDSEEENCVTRMVENSRFSEASIRARMACQLPREEKKRYADIIIVNDGSLQELIEKAREAYKTVVSLGERSRGSD